MSESRVKKSLGQITAAFEALVQATETHQKLNNVEDPVDKPYENSTMDAIPEVPTCFDSGLVIVSRFPLIIELQANLANSSSTDFPVSKTEDRRLLENTSGITSMNI
jgi:hypothetical protein